MELCTTAARAISNSNLPHHKPLITPNQAHLPWTSIISLKHYSISRKSPGSLYTNSSLKSTTSEETPSGATQYIKDEPDGVVTFNGVESTEKSGNEEIEVVKEETPLEDQGQPFEFLDKLNIELNSEDPVPIILFGGGGLAALWFATALVGAIDSIPVFPTLMEVVGLGYTIWFGTRYLLFKKNREELAANIEEIKQQVLGSKHD